jgi:hypothetical protein
MLWQDGDRLYARRRNGGGGSDVGASCEELNTEYVQQFELARMCSPELSVLQCTLATDSELFCPCPHLVNPANGAAVSKLSDLRGPPSHAHRYRRHVTPAFVRSPMQASAPHNRVPTLHT